MRKEDTMDMGSHLARARQGDDSYHPPTKHKRISVSCIDEIPPAHRTNRQGCHLPSAAIE